MLPIERTFKPTAGGLSTIVTIHNKEHGFTRHAEIPCTFANAPQIHSFCNGTPASEAFPLLNGEEMEFIKTGMLQNEKVSWSGHVYIFNNIRFDVWPAKASS